MTKATVYEPTDRNDWLRARHPNVNSTDVASLFNLSPYRGELELFHYKRTPFDALAPEPPEAEWTKWGKRLETPIAFGIGEDLNLAIVKKPEYMFFPEERLGSSFDFSFFADNGDAGVLEIKNVFGMAFAKNWTIDADGALEAPPWIELQVQVEMMVSGLDHAMIGALVGGNSIKVITRRPDAAIVAVIREKVKTFWRRVAADEPPPMDFRRDADFICQLYSQVTPGSVLDLSTHHDPGHVSHLAEVYRSAGEAEKYAREEKHAAKAELLTLIGEAAKVYGDGFAISASLIDEKRIESYDRKSYRDFRINWKKET